MPTAPIDDTTIYYEEHGAGFPLFLTYCLGGNHGMWADQVPALAERYRVILWDPRGHGGSESPNAADRYGVIRAAHDLAVLMDHLSIDRAHVGGLSMGGGISTRFAALYPDRTASLMIIDSNTAAGLPVSDDIRAVREETIRLCEARDMAAVADHFLRVNPSYKLFTADTDEGRARVRSMILAMNPVGFGHTIRSMLRQDFPTERLTEITAPTLVLAGEQDPAMAAVRVTHETISHSQLVIVPGAGHLSNLDQPEAFLAAILNYLEAVPA